MPVSRRVPARSPIKQPAPLEFMAERSGHDRLQARLYAIRVAFLARKNHAVQNIHVNIKDQSNSPLLWQRTVCW